VLQREGRLRGLGLEGHREQLDSGIRCGWSACPPAGRSAGVPASCNTSRSEVAAGAAAAMQGWTRRRACQVTH